MSLWLERSFTRPATSGSAYSVGDLIANSATASLVVPMVLGRSHRASHLVLRSVVVSKSNTSLTDASFRVRLFSAAPVLSGGDNSALTGNLASLHRGSYSTVMDTAYVDGAVGVAVSDSDIPVSFDEPMWALLEARAAYPENASETFRLWFELAQPD